MPEGDTIWRSAAALRERLRGRRVTAARPAALSRLVGRRLVSVQPVGKHLYMHFDGGVVLHTHMRMTGTWQLAERGRPWRRPAHRATAVLGFDDVEAVLFAAPVCELIAASQVGAGLGPDILGESFDVVAVAARARASPRPTVAEVLLDQSVCAGIGNIHRCNALWHERADPFLPVTAMDDAALTAVLRRARDLLRRGAVADRFRPASAVHGRAGRPCSRCGMLIAARPLGRPPRTLFWCPGCQVGGSAGGHHPVRDDYPLEHRRDDHQ